MAADKQKLNDKLGKLSPELQEIFVATIEQMLRQETSSMLHFIRETRADMSAAVRIMQHGQRALRAAPVDTDRPAIASGGCPVTRDARPLSSFSTISARSVMTPSGIDLVDMMAFDADDCSVQGAAGWDIKTSEGLTDDVPQGADSQEIPGFYREMTKEMIVRLASATARIDRERRRQADLAKERHDTKKAKKLEEVARLFEFADSSLVEKEKTRQRQGDKLRQKIEEIRNQKIETSQM